MPMDATGTYRNNHEQAKMHSESAGKKYEPDGKPKHGEGGEGNGDHTEIEDHGDGSFTTHPDGEHHETIGHLHAHISKLHGEEGHSHFHAHHDGMGGMHSHSVKSGEEPEHREHDSEEGVHEHLSAAMGGDGGEEDHDENPEAEQQHPAGAGLAGLY